MADVVATDAVGRSRLRVLHIAHQFLPEHVGGTETYTRALARRQLDAGHQATVLARRFADGRRCIAERFDSVPVVRVVDGPFTPVGRLRDSIAAPYLSACIRAAAGEARPDVVHIQHGMGLPAGALAAVAATYPTVVTLHDYWWVCANAQAFSSVDDRVCEGPRMWVNCAGCGLSRVSQGQLASLSPVVAPAFAARAMALRRVSRHVLSWIAPTDFVRDWHVAHGFPESRTHTIRHGIVPPPIDATAESPRKRRDGDPLRVAYLGGLSHQKGVHVLVAAVNAVGDRATLVVAGDESVFPDYCRSLHRAADPGRVRFVGLLDEAAVWRQLAAADVVVVPSLWYETSSLIAQEAFAVGTPVVASSHGALAERVRDGIDGLLVAPGSEAALRDALRRLIEEPGLLESLRGGIAPVRTLDAHAADVEDLYRQAMAARGR